MLIPLDSLFGIPSEPYFPFLEMPRLGIPSISCLEFLVLLVEGVQLVHPGWGPNYPWGT